MTLHIDMTEGVTKTGIDSLISTLTINSIAYNMRCLKEEGRKPWTDEQIAKIYGNSALAQWKNYLATFQGCGV